MSEIFEIQSQGQETSSLKELYRKLTPCKNSNTKEKKQTE